MESEELEGYDEETPYFQNAIDPETEQDLVEMSKSLTLKKVRRNG